MAGWAHERHAASAAAPTRPTRPPGRAAPGRPAGDRLPPAAVRLRPVTWKEIAQPAGEPADGDRSASSTWSRCCAIGRRAVRHRDRSAAAGARAAGLRGCSGRWSGRGRGRCSGCGWTSRARCGRGTVGFLPWLWMALKDPVGWRTLLYDLIRLPWGILTFAVTLTSLFVLWPVLPFLARGLTNAGPGDGARAAVALRRAGAADRRAGVGPRGRGRHGGRRPAAHRARPARRGAGPAGRPRDGPRPGQGEAAGGPRRRGRAWSTRRTAR